jgi:hypothetical protein
MVAKLIGRLLATGALWVRHKQRSGQHTLAHQKISEKDNRINGLKPVRKGDKEQ